MNGIGAGRPALERQVRWTVVRLQRGRGEAPRDGPEHARRPAVERFGLVAAIARERSP